MCAWVLSYTSNKQTLLLTIYDEKILKHIINHWFYEISKTLNTSLFSSFLIFLISILLTNRTKNGKKKSQKIILLLILTFFFKTNSSENKNIATKELIASKTSILFKSFCMSVDTYPVHTPVNFWILIGESIMLESQQSLCFLFPSIS